MSDTDDIQAALEARAAQGPKSDDSTDDIDAALKARAAQTDIPAAEKPTSIGQKLYGAGDVVATGLLNIPHAVMGSVHDIVSRATGSGPNQSAPLEASLGPSGQRLIGDIKNSDLGKKVGAAATSADN